jgi:BASS family bile acid:Na+ symporter
MKADQVINLLATITLIEMMLTIGLGVPLFDVVLVCRRWGLITRAALANYILVPLIAVALLRVFHAAPMVAAGFLVAAVCPGAPYGPPITSIAHGNVAFAVGLMVFLAGSSAILAPILLGFLLPFVAGDTRLTIDVGKIVTTLLGAQLLPLCIGLWIHSRHARLAATLKRPAGILSLLLNLLLLTVILVLQFRMFSEIHAKGYFGMLLLVFGSMAAGWLVSISSGDSSKTMVLMTSVRNVGVALVIATSCFRGTAAISSTTAYGVFQTVALACIALLWGQIAPGIAVAEKKAA